MRRSSCFYCGYLKKIKLPDGGIRYYCNDIDCEVDPYEPSCTDENYES